MSELIGYILTLDALFTWGIASLVYKFALGKIESKPGLLFRLIFVSCSTFLLALFFGTFSFLPLLSSQNLANYLIACLISGLSVTIGDLLYFGSLKRIDASRAFPLTQLSLIFVYPFAFIFFGEDLKLSILLGGTLILLSAFVLSTKDKDNLKENGLEKKTQTSEKMVIGVLLAIGAAILWGLSIVAFNQARIISSDVFVTNFIRVFMGAIFFMILGIFQKGYYASFHKENRKIIKYFIFVGIAGSLSLGLADTLFYKAAELNGLVLTSTFTANTPMIQQILSILILKEKFRKRFIFAVGLIIIGNYIILFL
ncbi:MAG: DMT family transporter [Candidatus Lokiarchaeota archaeon]|nr:DMT family transporter [Candidatus Lokiarchaeota archaeon]